MSRWLPLATVAIEDRRFYSHGGIDAEGIARALWRDLNARPRRRGRLDDHAAARPHPLHLERAHRRAEGHRGVPGREARPQVVEGANSRHVPQLRSSTATSPTAPRRPRARTSHARRAALTLSQAALLAGLTKAPSAYDPFVDPARAVARRNEVLLAMLAGADDHPEAVREREPGPLRRPAARAISTRRSGSRTSSASCATSSSGRTAPRPFARAACASTRRSSRAAAARARGDLGDADRPRRPRRGGHLDRPGIRRDPRDDRDRPRAARTTSSTCSRRRAGSPARPSRRSCSPRRSSGAWTRTRRTTCRRRSRTARSRPATARTGRGGA